MSPQAAYREPAHHVWLRPDSIQNNMTIIDKGGPSGLQEFQLGLMSGQVQVTIGAQGGDWALFWRSNARVTALEWTHIAVTWDGGIIHVYINGVLNDTIPFYGVVRNGTSDVLLGAARSALVNGAPQDFFVGTIDELYIYGPLFACFLRRFFVLLLK